MFLYLGKVQYVLPKNVAREKSKASLSTDSLVKSVSFAKISKPLFFPPHSLRVEPRQRERGQANRSGFCGLYD